jgi:hypothetical protein
MLSFGQLYLETPWPDRLADFLAPLLDLQVGPGRAERTFSLVGDVTIRIAPCETPATKYTTMVDWRLESYEELEDLRQRALFQIYRSKEKNVREEDLEIHGQDGSYYLDIRDPDGRPWRFSFEQKRG